MKKHPKDILGLNPDLVKGSSEALI